MKSLFSGRFSPFTVSFAFLVGSIPFSILYVYSRSFKTLQPDREQVLGVTIAFTTLIFGLLLGFTVSNFWQKFIELNESIVEEVESFLRFIRIAKDYPGTEALIGAIRNYAEDTLYKEWPLLKKGASSLSKENEEIFRKIIYEMNEYAIAHPLSSEVEILYSLIPSRQKINSFFDKGANESLIYFNISCALIVIFCFWFLRIENTFAQIAVDASMISIIVISIFILYEFYQPFYGIFSVDLEIFQKIIDEPF